MSYRVETGWGDGHDNPSVEQLGEILASPWMADVEHGGAWLTHDSEWTLSFESPALLIWHRHESGGEARHIKGVTRDRVLRLWCKLASGKIDEIEREPWQPGYGWEARTAEQQAELDAHTRKMDRAFYDSLGQERAGTRCQHADCARGTVVASVLCRVHHFEALKHKTCPFVD